MACCLNIPRDNYFITCNRKYSSQHICALYYGKSKGNTVVLHNNVPSIITFSSAHSYTWMERGTMGIIKIVLPKNTTQCPKPGLKTHTVWSKVQHSNHEAWYQQCSYRLQFKLFWISYLTEFNQDVTCRSKSIIENVVDKSIILDICQ